MSSDGVAAASIVTFRESSIAELDSTNGPVMHSGSCIVLKLM